MKKVLTLYNLPATRSDFNMSFGYIKMSSDIAKEYYKSKDPIQTLTNTTVIDDSTGKNKQYILFHNMECKTETEVETALTNNWIFKDTDLIYFADNNQIRDTIYLNWQDKIKLNIDNKEQEYIVYNLQQVFLDPNDKGVDIDVYT